MPKKYVSIDGNTAAAYTAHATNEVIAIYPITPSSVMGELADEYSAHGKTNIWGQVPRVVELQSEGGASGAIHGALTGGALATTFTASQGLLLMLPNMFKISGELAPTVFHISARSISCQALSIFGDHSDIMCARSAGFGIVLSGNPQEVMDNALIAQAAALKSRVPFLHAFDGFRTSHEIQKIEEVPFEVMAQMLDEEDIVAVRSRALRPENPTMRGTAQNPDLYFQGREAVNPFYDKCPDIFQAAYDRFAKLTGRQYRLFDYYGAPDAEAVMVIMGSGAETAEEAVAYLHEQEGKKCGLLKVRLYRPFSTKRFLEALPATAKTVVAMDRTKEPGSDGEPLYLDVRSACVDGTREGKFKEMPLVIGGRYGLSSKEFTPAMVKAVFKHAWGDNPFSGFTVGIHDDVSHLSLDFSEEIDSEHPSTYRAKFYGLGADGTVGASKNTIKVFGENTDKYVQGFFVYDSKKAGGVTCSHLRFSDKPIRSTYLITKPDFVAVHAESFLGRIDVLKGIKEGGTVLINTYTPPEELFNRLPRREQETIINKKLRLYCINAYEIAIQLGIPGRINTTMQAAFFKVSGILPEDVYARAIEGAITKTYSGKGSEVVEMNIKAFRLGMEKVVEAPVPSEITVSGPEIEPVEIGDEDVRVFYDEVLDPVGRQEGDEVPVSRMPADGAFPTATSQYEKRSIATHLPVWNPELCIQCNLCSFVCPHAAIRPKVHRKSEIKLPADEYITVPYKDKLADGEDVFRIQVFPEDCTGCRACVVACPGEEKVNKEKTGRKALEMVLKNDVIDGLKVSVKEFLRLPETDDKFIKIHTYKGSQFKRPLLEFSGACAGCGETPYTKLVTQLFGDRMMQANATGCSSIWGGTAPSSPYCVNEKGHGPAWSSSLFEDNAEFGFGMRLAVNALHQKAFDMRERMLADGSLPGEIKDRLARLHSLSKQAESSEAIETNKELTAEIAAIIDRSNGKRTAELAYLREMLPYFIKKSIWIVGGDGWAYDIGFGGLDHVLAMGDDVNLLVLDTEVYSNTGGQRSKATPMSAVAKFASAGKESAKKDLGLMAMSYRSAYVASVCYSAKPGQVVRAMLEAESFPGTSLIIAYSHCIEHGFPLEQAQAQGKLAVESGYWPIYRYDPRLIDQGKNPLQLDMKEPKATFRDYAMTENRFRRLLRDFPEEGEALLARAEKAVHRRWLFYKALAEMDYSEFAEKVKAEAAS